MNHYRVTVSLNISSIHKLRFQIVARSIGEAADSMRHWDRVKIERIRR
jgi:hypothetical protein